MKDAVMILALLTLIGLLLALYNKRLKQKVVEPSFQESPYEVKAMVAFVKDAFNDMLKINLYEMNLTKSDFEKKMYNKNQLKKALKNCTYGDINAKNYIKQFIRDLLLNDYGINEETVLQVIPFHKPHLLTPVDQFECLLYHHKQFHGNHALGHMIEHYRLDRAQKDESGITYRIEASDIREVFEACGPLYFSFSDRLNIVVQRVYQHYKGYGVIDEIRDMRIDGVSGGVSGLVPSMMASMHDLSREHLQALPFNYDAIWIFFKGKTIHLDFLSFESERELIRICKNIYRYNKPGQLSESNGYKINEMKDGARVVVARPPFCESWIFFVRKFDSVKQATLDELIQDEHKDLPIDLLKWLVRGCRVMAVTGSQGAGKTTLLMALIQYINPAFSLRIQETAFELNLRKIYPTRNVVTFRETATVSGQEGLDLQKKTDGVVNILGEVATAPVAALMIQMAQVASLFTLFTHHAKTAEHLIYALRNNLLQTGVFSNEKVAEQQVAEVINFDIHLGKDLYGHRYIERITEIIPLDLTNPYPSTYQEMRSPDEKIAHFMDTMTSFFERMTDRKTFETRDLVVYKDGAYHMAEPMSEKSQKAILKQLDQTDGEAFKAFMGTVFNNTWAMPS